MSEDLLTRIVTSLPIFAIFLFALSVHEAAHAWMAKQCGDLYAFYEGRMTLNPLSHIDPVGTILLPLISIVGGGLPFIGWARPVPVVEGNLRRPSDMMWIALAGPASNIILAVWAILAFKIYLVVDQPFAAASGVFWREVYYYPFYFIFINVFLAAFNMIPVPPLDGSRVFFHLFVFGSRRQGLKRFWESWEQFGFFLLILVVFSGAFSYIIGPAIDWFGGQVLTLVTA